MAELHGRPAWGAIRVPSDATLWALVGSAQRRIAHAGLLIQAGDSSSAEPGSSTCSQAALGSLTCVLTELTDVFAAQRARRAPTQAGLVPGMSVWQAWALPRADI
jgi:hypothetical protein